MVGAHGKKKKGGELKRTESNEAAVRVISRLERRVDDTRAESCLDAVMQQLADWGVEDLDREETLVLVSKGLKALGCGSESTEEIAVWIAQKALHQPPSNLPEQYRA